MQCANCGRPLRPNETLCPFCGEPVSAPDSDGSQMAQADAVTVAGETYAQRQEVHRSGPPVDPFAPTIYGPPVGPERYARAYPAPAAPPMRRVEGYRVVTPPASPFYQPHRPGSLRAFAVVAALAVLLLLAGGALAATGHRVPGLGPLFGEVAVPTATATVRPSPTPACPAPAINPQAAAALDQVRLSTGVSGAALQPTDVATTFTVGQTVHVVFHIQSAEGGVVNASFCTNGAVSVSNRPLDVPAGYAKRLGANARGQFYLTLAPGNVGPGLVTLTWNGQPAAVVPFTVTAA